MEPGLGAVIFLTLCVIVVFSIGAFLVYRVMNTPGSHIGSHLPKHDPHAEAAPTDTSDRGSAADQFDPEGTNFDPEGTNFDPEGTNSTDDPDRPEDPEPRRP